MPLPSPRSNENEAEFINRCVSDDEIEIETADADQALAVCQSLWDQSQDKNMPSPNEQLLTAIKTRGQKQTGFGNGILTADRYTQTLLDCVGSDACYKYAAAKGQSFDDVMRKAAKTLTYRNPEMTIEGGEKEGILYGKQPGVSVKSIKAADVEIELPPNTLMVFRHILTTTSKDRDGDILRTAGAEVDPSMLLLWQHVHSLPIGKMLAVAEHTANKLTLISAIIDMGELAHDAAVMADNGMARYSHGFRALEFDTLKEDEGETTSPGGFDIKRFEIMEASMVSVPSNVDAETEEVLLSMVEGGKLTSGLMKAQGKDIRSRRKKQFALGGVEGERKGVVIQNTVWIDDDGNVEIETEGKSDEKQSDATECQCGGGTRTPEETDEKTGDETETTTTKDAEVKHHGCPLDGSWEDVEDKLRRSAKSYLESMAVGIDERDWVWLAGTFSDHVVVCVEKPESGVPDEFRYFKVGWETKDGEPKYKGTPEEVEIVTTTEIIERSPGFPSKSGELTGDKAGRVMSQRNLQAVIDVKEDIEELSEKEDDMTRGGKAICERCITKLTGIIDSATTTEETSADEITAKQAMEIIITGNLEDQKHILEVLRAMDTARVSEQKGKQYRTLVGTN